MFKWLSNARLKQISEITEKRVDDLAVRVDEIFKEVFENMEDIDGRVDVLSCLYVKGTQKAATNAWTGVLGGVSALFDGLTIEYHLPCAGTASPATLTLTLEGEVDTEAIPVYRDGTNPVTSQFAAGSILRLTYLEEQNRWQHSAISDTTFSVSYDAERKALSLLK